MKRWNYTFSVPEKKRVRLLVYTDCANEADDQFALAHSLMTPKVEVCGIIAAHFDKNTTIEGFDYRPGTTAQASLEEIHRVLSLMELEGCCPVAKGAEYPLIPGEAPFLSEGAQMIVTEALKEEERPLFIGCQGSLTDLAAAILVHPEICSRMTAIWVGGGDYPSGGFEFNLMQDPLAAQILFSSQMPVWQIPMKVYKTLAVSLAELQYKVAPCGKLGEYLFSHMIHLNEKLAVIPQWPHGELWGLGDQAVLAVLMQENERTDNFHLIPAPDIDTETMAYRPSYSNRSIRVYDWLDTRLTLEDFFAKLAINYRM